MLGEGARSGGREHSLAARKVEAEDAESGGCCAHMRLLGCMAWAMLSRIRRGCNECFSTLKRCTLPHSCLCLADMAWESGSALLTPWPLVLSLQNWERHCPSLCPSCRDCGTSSALLYPVPCLRAVTAVTVDPELSRARSALLILCLCCSDCRIGSKS